MTRKTFHSCVARVLILNKIYVCSEVCVRAYVKRILNVISSLIINVNWLLVRPPSQQSVNTHFYYLSSRIFHNFNLILSRSDLCVCVRLCAFVNLRKLSLKNVLNSLSQRSLHNNNNNNNNNNVGNHVSRALSCQVLNNTHTHCTYVCV